jgi:hypothetical protein
MHELIGNRGTLGEIRTARRARNAEVSGDESRRVLSLGLRGAPVSASRRPPRDGAASGSDASSETPLGRVGRVSLSQAVDLFSAPLSGASAAHPWL